MDRGAIGFAISGLILVLIGTVMPKWLDYWVTDVAEGGMSDIAEVSMWKARFAQPDYKPGGPWEIVIKFSDGKTEHAQYQWFFGSWMNACR